MKFIIFYLSLIWATESVSAAFLSSSAGKLVGCPLSATGNKLISELNRTDFYKAIRSDNITLVDAQISELNATPSNIQNAFLGAMTMKKAGIGGNPVSKLFLFKKGHDLLEAAIKEDQNNSEFRFLRLMIQENAPGILGYKDNEKEDSELIRKSYKSMPDDLKKTIADYNKISKVLRLQDS